MSDMRRKNAMDRKVAKLEKVADTLTRLINALRDSESRRVSQLLNLIRSNASFDELQLFLEQQFSHYELESTPELRDIQSQLSQTTDLAPLGWRYLRVDRLADDPVYKVPAKPWTAVTDDSELVSHLVSLWLTWTYPWFNWLDADCLIKHMQEGKLNSRFCSPFLVNAILAEACVYVLARMMSVFLFLFSLFFITDSCIVLLRLRRSIYSARRPAHSRRPILRRGASSVRGWRRRRRLSQPAHDPGAHDPLRSVSRIVGCETMALADMAIRTSMMGKDRMGWVYLDLAARGAQEYAASHPPHAMEDAEERRAIDRTLWGIFSMASYASRPLFSAIHRG